MEDNNNNNVRSTSTVAEGTDPNADGEVNSHYLEGGLDEVQMHLTCLPERYMRAKFTLSAYILCWTILKLCQGLRRSPAMQQVRQPFPSTPLVWFVCHILFLRSARAAEKNRVWLFSALGPEDEFITYWLYTNRHLLSVPDESREEARRSK
ncbi:hypothetical protein MATL_G00243520 [Megalops atlanticus]|uniref:Uncharacterized protein n=1 Tax=Megalops atlanticus TaxID=7932 RepID=A0A9D3SXN4_MEGAT|nr:hypothetical protein MATL_G00243520 [Megalops atlanticus]